MKSAWILPAALGFLLGVVCAGVFVWKVESDTKRRMLADAAGAERVWEWGYTALQGSRDSCLAEVEKLRTERATGSPCNWPNIGTSDTP